MHKTFKIVTAILLLAGAMITFTGCGKKTTAPAVANNTQGGKYYLTGSIDGAAFKANLVAAGDTAGLMLVVGVQIINKDTSIIVIVFPDNVPMNQAINYNANYKTILAYGNSTYPSEPDVFVTAQTANQSSGSFTVTAINSSSQTVSGTFNAVATSQNDGAVNITNGKFYMPFKVEQGPGLGGNIKF